MTDKIYKKEIDGSFVEMGYEFTGWPANGIWVVEDSRQNCIYQFEGTPVKPTPSLVSYMQYEDELSDYLQDTWSNKERISLRDISQLACEFFALKAGGMKIKDEIIEN